MSASLSPQARAARKKLAIAAEGVERNSSRYRRHTASGLLIQSLFLWLMRVRHNLSLFCLFFYFLISIHQVCLFFFPPSNCKHFLSKCNINFSKFVCKVAFGTGWISLSHHLLSYRVWFHWATRCVRTPKLVCRLRSVQTFQFWPDLPSRTST